MSTYEKSRIYLKSIAVGLTLLLSNTGNTEEITSHKNTNDKGFIYAWTQYGWENISSDKEKIVPDPRFIIRTIVKTNNCPTALVDGVTQALVLRTKTPPTNFKYYVCEAYLALNNPIKSIILNGFSLPTPISNPETIIVVGDTGCRSASQNCSPKNTYNPGWYYEKIAAEAANDPQAHKKPDLIVHVGDMHYRESNNGDCAQTKNGPCWESWEADFFIPSQAFFNVAPLVMARGNHESCTRSWRGWFYFLAPEKLDTDLDWSPTSCEFNLGKQIPDGNYTPSYSIPFDDLQILMLDTSITTYDDCDCFDNKKYTKLFNDLSDLYNKTNKPVWVVTHQPFWSILSSNGKAKASTPFSSRNKYSKHYIISAMTPSTQLKPNLLKKGLLGKAHTIDAVISGHIHLSEIIEFKDHRPHQIVAGASGTKLESALPHPVDTDMLWGVKSFNYLHKFDYFVMTYNSHDHSWDVRQQVVNTSAITTKIGGR